MQVGAAQPQEPVAAVPRGSEHGVVAPEEGEGPGHVGGLQLWDVAADQDGRPARLGLECPHHAHAEVALALGGAGHGRRPEPARRREAVRRHEQGAAPARIGGEAPDLHSEGIALEAPGGDGAELGREAALDPAQARRLGEDQEPARHP